MSDPNTLTARQLEVTRLVANDLTNREIADRLGISLETVKQHVSAAMASRGVRRREALGDWYHATHRSGVRRLRAMLATPLALLAVGGGVATVGVVSLIAVAIVGGVDTESLPGATSSTSVISDQTDSALDTGPPEVTPTVEPSAIPLPLADGRDIPLIAISRDGGPLLRVKDFATEEAEMSGLPTVINLLVGSGR